MNTNQLGGAERSLVEQLSLSSEDSNAIFFIPKLKLPDSELIQFLRQKKFSQIRYYPFPGFLYRISRKDLKKSILLILSIPSILCSLWKWHNSFKEFESFYVNGNKALLPILLWSGLSRKKIKVIWHFRDFPSGGVFKILSRLIQFSGQNITFKLVANSLAVADEVKSIFPEQKVECLYNLAGCMPSRSAPEKIKHIGVVSMFAPWKGIHTVVLMAALYEKELRELGIEKISIYGGNIYMTDGEHQKYAQEIHQLALKSNAQLIEWGGRLSPPAIFSAIDLLIHPSILPEPFGRVIIEAFKSHIPVISTALGGAKELLAEGSGAIISPYDYEGLYESIQVFCLNPNQISKVTTSGFKKATHLESEVLERSSLLLKF